MAKVKRQAPAATGEVPAELDAPTADVWQDQATYVSYMADHGYHLDVRTRTADLDIEGAYLPSPESRRRAAHAGWRERGVR